MHAARASRIKADMVPNPPHQGRTQNKCYMAQTVPSILHVQGELDQLGRG